MKRLLSILFILSLIVTMNNKTFAKVYSSDTIQADGIVMSTTDFKNTFSGEPSSRIPISKARSVSNASISLSNIVINNDTIDFTAVLTVNNTTTTLPVKGKLSSGHKVQQGINSIIIDVSNTVNGYNFLLFEICNDSDKNDLLVANQKNTTTFSTNDPYIKIYMQDQNNNIYLFETKMPDVFSNLNANQFPKADKFKDSLWAVHLAKGETKELVTDNTILQNFGLNTQTKGLNTWSTWINPTTYYHSFYVGSIYTQCWSMPYVEYKHVNVHSSDSTWIASFKIAEHMLAAGNTYYGNNVFEYKNLQISFGCGDKTTFIRTLQEGRMRKNSSILQIGSEITVDLLKKVVSTLPYGSTFQTVLNSINSMNSTTTRIKLGNEGISLMGQKTTAVGEKLDKDYFLDKCTNYNGGTNNGHYFTYQATLQYDSAAGNTNTVGALSFSFNKCFTVDASSTPISNSIPLNYSSQP